MIAAGLIVVAADDDIGTAEDRAAIVAPLASAHRITGRWNPAIAERDDILFALDDEDRMLLRDVLDQFRQPIGDNAHALDRPFLLLGAGALAKLFRCIERLEAQHLEQPRAALVDIVIDRFDGPEFVVFGASVVAARLLEMFAAAAIAAVAKPRDFVALDLDVEISGPAFRAVGRIGRARSRRPGDAVSLQQLLRREHGHARPPRPRSPS